MSGTNLTFINRCLILAAYFYFAFMLNESEHNWSITYLSRVILIRHHFKTYNLRMTMFFRLLMNLPYRCRVSPHFIALGMNHFTVIRRKLVHSLYQRILYSSNTLINSLGLSSVVYSSSSVSNYSSSSFHRIYFFGFSFSLKLYTVVDD